MHLFLIVLYILCPILVIYLCSRFPLFNKISVVVICYIAGITIGNIGILPEDALSLQNSISEITVALALPLLLFSLNVRRWTRLAGKTILSMMLATVAITLIAVITVPIFKNSIPQMWQISGMAVGVYTGGTPNLAAIKTALGVSSSRYVMMHTYDTIISMVFIIFCITMAQRFFLAFLPPFEKNSHHKNEESPVLETEDIQSYRGIFALKTLLPLLGAVLLSAVIVGISVLLSKPFDKAIASSIVIILITTLGIVASFVRPIRSIGKTFQAGMYLIYIFCLVVGSMTNIRLIIDIDPALMLFVIVAIFGTMILHALLCKLFDIDADTFIITSASAICSPPFVPVVANALKNREVILTGLTTGIIGYAIGNYLGISVGYLLKSFLF